MDDDQRRQDELMRTMALLKVAFDLRQKRYHGFEQLIDEAVRDMDLDPVEFAAFAEEHRDDLEDAVHEHGYNDPADDS